MTDVKRYDYTLTVAREDSCEVTMTEEVDGQYVLYSDYLALQESQGTRSIVALIAEIENLSLPPVSKEKLKFITDKYKVSNG